MATAMDAESRFSAAGASMVAMVIVTAAVILGPIFHACFSQAHASSPIRKNATAFMVALGAGVLLGDAIMHLLPAALGVHEHEHEHDEGDASAPAHEDEEVSLVRVMGVALAVLAGIYIFYVSDILFGHDHGHDHDDHGTGQLEARKATETSPLVGASTASSTTTTTTVSSPASPIDAASAEAAVNADMAVNVAVDDHLGRMLLIGDAAHNLVDGLVIAVSFAAEFSLGFSTTLAVLLHEIPHEISDFAILTDPNRVGWSFSKALLWIGLSQLTGFIGAGIGIALGEEPSVLPYLLAITAGMFIFLSIYKLLPELKHTKGDSRWLNIWRHSGILVGIGLMCLVLYVEDLNHH